MISASRVGKRASKLNPRPGLPVGSSAVPARLSLQAGTPLELARPPAAMPLQQSQTGRSSRRRRRYLLARNAAKRRQLLPSLTGRQRRRRVGRGEPGRGRAGRGLLRRRAPARARRGFSRWTFKLFRASGSGSEHYQRLRIVFGVSESGWA